MTERNKLWTIDDVDRQGNLGMTVLLARNEDEARAKFHKMHGGFLEIVEIEPCLSISLAMWKDVSGATGYFRRDKLAGMETECKFAN